LYGRLPEFPARRFTLEVLFPKRKDDAGEDGEDWFFHRQDIVFHARHIELVLSLIRPEKFPPGCQVGDLRDALDYNCLARIFCADHAFRVLRKVSRFARLAPCTENKPGFLPEAPDDHRVRCAVRLHGGDPVIMRFLQALLGPGPRQQSLAALGKAVTRSVEAGRFWRCRFSIRLFGAHNF
jgi:hypothetical protein